MEKNSGLCLAQSLTADEHDVVFPRVTLSRIYLRLSFYSIDGCVIGQVYLMSLLAALGIKIFWC